MPGPVWIVWTEEKSAPAGNRTPIPWLASPGLYAVGRIVFSCIDMLLSCFFFLRVSQLVECWCMSTYRL